MFKSLKESLKKIGLIKMLGIVLALIVLSHIMFNDVPYDYTWSAWTLPLSGHVFIIDSGHGGPDGGASSKDGTLEKTITLQIAKYLRDYLNEAGAFVIMTRETDRDLALPGTKGLARRKQEDLENRIKLANNSMGDFFISIHLNSIPSEKWHGSQTFYYPAREQNKIMAENIQAELVRNLENTDRTPLPRNNIMVLRYVDMPSVMIEAGFMSNPKEANLLNTEEYQKQIAFAIYQGMLNYYSDSDNLSNSENQ